MANGDMIEELKNMAADDKVTTKSAVRLMLSAMAGMYEMQVANEGRINKLEKNDKRWATLATFVAVAFSSIINTLKGE